MKSFTDWVKDRDLQEQMGQQRAFAGRRYYLPQVFQPGKPLISPLRRFGQQAFVTPFALASRQAAEEMGGGFEPQIPDPPLEGFTDEGYVTYGVYPEEETDVPIEKLCSTESREFLSSLGINQSRSCRGVYGDDVSQYIAADLENVAKEIIEKRLVQEIQNKGFAEMLDMDNAFEIEVRRIGDKVMAAYRWEKRPGVQLPKGKQK